MAAKTYQLNIERSDGNIEKVSFTIPEFIGTYNIKFVLSDGEEIDAGNITVDDTEHTYNLKLTLSDGSTITAGTIVTPVGVPSPKPTFESASWTKIAKISEAGVASEYFAVGDEKTIRLSTGEEITVVILGFNHDDLSDGSGKAGITIGMKNLISTTYPMNSTDTNEGGWDESELRTSTISTLFSQLPSELQSVIKQVNKKATAGGASKSITTSADKLWLLARVEVDGTTNEGDSDEGKQYEYWKTVKDGTVTTDRVKYLSNGSGDSYAWWFRSPFVNLSNSFYIVNRQGFLASRFASLSAGVSFCFCV